MDLGETVRESIRKFYDRKVELKSYKKDNEPSKYTMDYFDKLEKQILDEANR